MRQIPRIVPYALMIAFAVWCGYLFRADVTQMSLAPVLHSWDLVVAAAVLSLLNYALRIVRWRMYVGRLGYRLSLTFAALTFTAGFAYTLSPAKVGEMVRARYYAPYGVPLSEVAAAFFAERLMDLVAMVLLASLLLTAASGYQSIVLAASVGIVLLLVSLAVVPWNDIAQKLGSRHWPSKRLRTLTLGILSSVVSTRALLSPGLLLSGFVIGLVAWGLEGIGLNVLSGIFTPHMGITTAVGIYGVAVLVGGLSFLPGGLGSTEAIMAALLTAHGLPVSEALLLTLICRLVTLWLAVGLGWLAVLALRQRPSEGVVAPWP
jgi:uncharacterized protein (TIRG00374 family)